MLNNHTILFVFCFDNILQQLQDNSNRFLYSKVDIQFVKKYNLDLHADSIKVSCYVDKFFGKIFDV